MTPSEQMKEIERMEDWFRSVCADADGADLYRIKRHVHLELNEQWLAGQLQDLPQPGLAADAKIKVRETMQQVEATPLHDSIQPVLHRESKVASSGRLWRWSGLAALATAATLFILVGPFASETSSSPNMELATAFELYQQDDLAGSVFAIDEDLDALEDAWNSTDIFADAGDSFDSILSDLKNDDSWDSDSDDWTQMVLEDEAVQ